MPTLPVYMTGTMPNNRIIEAQNRIQQARTELREALSECLAEASDTELNQLAAFFLNGHQHPVAEAVPLTANSNAAPISRRNRPPLPPDGFTQAQRRAYNRDNLLDIMDDGEKGAEWYIKDLTAALAQRGKTPRSYNPKKYVTTTLREDPAFRRVRRGVYVKA